MSFTAAYSELMALDVDAGERLGRNPRIQDRGALLEWPETRGDISTDAFQKMLIVEDWTDRDAYPTQTWKVLCGFKTWLPSNAFHLSADTSPDAVVDTILGHETRSESPLGYTYNMERIGIPYGGIEGFWKTMFEAVSEHTEPFAVYHSPIRNRFPDVTDFQGGEESVYYIEAVDGELYVEEQTFRRVAADPLVDDRDRVAATEVRDDE